MRKQRGFSLVEILLAVALFGVFIVIAMHLLRANIDVARATISADVNSARFDSAIAALRADLADSSSCGLPQPGLLQIHLTDHQTVEWRTESDGLSRKQGAHVQNWIIDQELKLKVDGAIVLLGSPDDPANQLAFASPPSLAEGDKR
jgi:prepilin-type N-terminal cleavage/methylation domain-containing protein